MVTQVTSADNFVSRHPERPTVNPRGRNSEHIVKRSVRSLRLDRKAIVGSTAKAPVCKLIHLKQREGGFTGTATSELHGQLLTKRGTEGISF